MTHYTAKRSCVVRNITGEFSHHPIHNRNLPGAALQWAQASAGHTEWKFAEYAGG